VALTDKECFLCGRTGQLDRHHLIGGTANRKQSEKYGLVVYLCRNCHRLAHEDSGTYLQLHQYGERLWLKNEGGTVEDFIKVFGKNYLED
jgi:5-methylcytosine-specific restriction endonuclease McrA